MIHSFLREGTTCKYINGISSVPAENEDSKIADFERRLEQIRKAERISDHSALPAGGFCENHFEWKHRQASLALVMKEIGGRKDLKILEVSPYNNWLTHHLNDHTVVCLDFFRSPVFGLGNRRHHRDPKWLSVQCDVEQPGFLTPVFDLIILNHCVQFFGDPLHALREYRKLLSPSGKLLIAGLTVYYSPGEKKRRVDAFTRMHAEKNDFEIFLRQTKGYIDGDDLKQMRRDGFITQWYPGFFLRNLAAVFVRSRPFYLFAKVS